MSRPAPAATATSTRTGFALESFDVIGGWRSPAPPTWRTTGERRSSQGRRVRPGPPRTHHGTLLGRTNRFQDVDEFKELLLGTDKDQLARNLAEKLLAYATGAEPTPLDRPHIDTIVRRVSDRRTWLPFPDLTRIVQSPLFQNQVTSPPVITNRRTFLRSAGVALALPWLESLAAGESKPPIRCPLEKALAHVVCAVRPARLSAGELHPRRERTGLLYAVALP